MLRGFVATGMMFSIVGSIVGCAGTTAAPKASFEQAVEHFEGVAVNSERGPRLQLDNGSGITCIVETETGENAWPADVADKRIRVEGYRIRSDSNDPNGVVIRCVNWRPATAPSQAQPGTRTDNR